MTSVSADSLPEAVSPEIVFFEACERNENVPVSAYLLGDNLAERILAAFMLIPALPVIGILILLIRCTSKGPALFRQQRVGQNGVVYTMYKLRTMQCDAEATTGPNLVDSRRLPPNVAGKPAPHSSPGRTAAIIQRASRET